MNKFRLKCQGGRWWVQEKFFGFLWLTIWNSSLTKESAMAKIAEHVQEKEDECIYYPHGKRLSPQSLLKCCDQVHHQPLLPSLDEDKKYDLR